MNGNHDVQTMRIARYAPLPKARWCKDSKALGVAKSALSAELASN
jgi:hypothetical protein